jgi:branched-chain amino acid transport system substrate-binding protein
MAVGNRARIGIGVMAALLALAGPGCGASSESGSGDSGEVDSLTIGATLPLTGSESRAGGLYKKGYDLAVKQHNDDGGIDLGGKKVEVDLKLLDDRSDQRSVVSLSRKLVTKDQVHAMLGTYSTSLSLAQAAIPESAGVPYVNGGGASTPIYRPEDRENKWTFGTISNITLMSELTADWIGAMQDAGKLEKPLRVALLPENTAHGEDYALGLRDWSKAHPGRIEIVLDEQFEEETADFTGLLGRVKAANADALLVDAHLPDFINMLRTYKTLGLSHKVVSYGARGSEAEAKETLGDATDYIISAQWWSPLLENEVTPKFIEAYKAAYREEPEWYAALAYETANVLIEAVDRADSVEPDAIREQLEQITYEPSLMPGGSITFPADNGRQAENGFVLTQNMPNGKTELIWPKDQATADGVVPGE